MYLVYFYVKEECMYSADFKNRDFLYTQFIELKKSPRQIGDMCNVSYKLVLIWLDHHGLLEKF